MVNIENEAGAGVIERLGRRHLHRLLLGHHLASRSPVIDDADAGDQHADQAEPHRLAE